MAGRELEKLFRTWRSELVPPLLPSAMGAHAGSALVAAALRRVAEQKRRRRRVRKLGTVVALAAAITGLGIGTGFELRPDPVVANASGSRVVVSDQQGEISFADGLGGVVAPVSTLEEGYGMRTEDGSATLAFPSGARAKIANRSSLSLTRVRTYEVLFLGRGGLDVEVPQLAPARGFSVETPDARVTVHGTRFSVLVEQTAMGPLTHVRVTRGIVSVQKDAHQVFLTAGQAWPADATRAQPPATPEPPTADDDPGLANDDDADNPRSPNAAPVAQGARGPRGKPRRFDSSELADQNERFARAMTAKKRGDAITALTELGAIRLHYPGSPLSQELRVERLRLLRGMGRTELAAREAKRYLREFPQGYAVAEAEDSLSELPP